MMEAASQAVSRTLEGIDPASLCGITISLEFDHDDEHKDDDDEEVEEKIDPGIHKKVKEYEAKKDDNEGEEPDEESK